MYKAVVESQTKLHYLAFEPNYYYYYLTTMPRYASVFLTPGLAYKAFNAFRTRVKIVSGNMPQLDRLSIIKEKYHGNAT